MKIYIVLANILILVGQPNNIIGQDQSHVYNFPVRPGTEEWSKLETYEDRLDAYNIPQSLLEEMNTGDLVQTCLNYPEFRLIMTRNSMQQGYDYLKSIFNGFQELEKRKDAGIELIKQYNKLNPVDIKNFNTLVEQGTFGFQFIYIEILLAQKNILTNIDNVSKKELIMTCVKNFEIMDSMPKYYGTFGLITPALVLGRLMEISKYQNYIDEKAENENLSVFIDKTYISDSDILYNIQTLSKSYLFQLNNEL